MAFGASSGGPQVHRVGGGGCTVEAQIISSGAGASVVYNDDDYTFALAWRPGSANNPVLGAQLQYAAGATWLGYGAACAGNIACTNRGPLDLPYAGSQYFAIDLQGGVPGAPYFLLLSLQPAKIPINRQCDLLLGGPLFLIKSTNASPAGNLSCPTAPSNRTC